MKPTRSKQANTIPQPNPKDIVAQMNQISGSVIDASRDMDLNEALMGIRL